jgi:hypothetical protein
MTVFKYNRSSVYVYTVILAFLHQCTMFNLTVVYQFLSFQYIDKYDSLQALEAVRFGIFAVNI